MTALVREGAIGAGLTVGLAALALIAPGCAEDAACRPGTLFLRITYEGAALQATSVEITAQVIGGNAVATHLSHTAGAANGSVEIVFPRGYPTGKSLSVAVEALMDLPSVPTGIPLGSAQRTVVLAPSCTVLMLTIGASPDLAARAGDLSSRDSSTDLSIEDFSMEDSAMEPLEDLGTVDLSRPDGGACNNLSGLVAYFPFNGDTLDHSGNGHDATNSSVTFMAGRLGQGVSIGSGGVIQASGTTMLAARTLCAWVDVGASSGLGQPVFVGGQQFAGDFYGLWASTSSVSCGQPNEMYQDRWGGSCSVGTVLTTNEWEFVCWAWDAATGRTFYGNGSASTDTDSDYSYSIGTVTIGSNGIGGTTSKATFIGTIDEASIWSRVLSKSEMDELYNGGSGCPLR